MAQSLGESRVVARGEGLAEQAYGVLREAILSHALPPGARLSVPELARQLEISRSPVREAIARIQYEGLADFEPHRGAVVARIDLPALAEIYQIREVLEGLAVRLAVESGDSALGTDLEQLWQDHRKAIDEGDEERRIDLDTAFHLRIREAADSERLAEQLDRLQGQIRLAMSTTAHRGGGMQAALAEHRAVLDAVLRGDAAGAEQLARDHIRRLRESLHEAAEPSVDQGGT